MAVPEHILSKPEELTPEEFERVKIHPRVGAEILRQVPFGAPVGELVLCHHERWDGLGYPAGLRGDEIPLGARILAIADCYSTLQADRPYRPARSQAEALAVLREFAGKLFDPTLVDLFTARTEVSSSSVVVPTTPASESAWIERQGLVALEDIAGAHREEHTLCEIAQALGSSLGVGDAMALIDEKMSKLVPFVTCALFLGDDTDGYVYRYAHGPGSEALLKWTPRSSSDIALRLPSCADGRGAHGEELAALLPCRLQFEERLIGAMVIYHTVSGCFTDEHRRVLGRVSEQAAAVIFNSTRFEQTQHESHGSADRAAEPPLARSARRGEAGARRANERYRQRHRPRSRSAEGNQRHVRTRSRRPGSADCRLGARAAVRQSDLSARFAGDEFVVVLTDCDSDQETRRVRDLHIAVCAHPFEPRPGVRVSLSISAGPARFPDDGRTFEELLAAADERMCTDKAGRRSRSSNRHAADRMEMERA
jgi:hypothetical protein